MPDAENPDQPAQASPEASTGWTDVGWTTNADAHILRAYHTPPPAIDIDNSRMYAIHDHHVHIGFNTTYTGLTVATVDGTPVAHLDLAEPAPARRETPGQATTGDVVERIDAAVEERCGCGCGREIRPDGPSAYFASQGCQRRWMEAQTSDPEDVYSREDAHGGNIDPDAPDARRRYDIPQPPGRRRQPDAAEVLLERLRVHDEEQAHRARMFDWRRYCPECRQRSEPPEQVAVREFGSERPIRTVEAPHQQCRHCGYVWPGLAVQAEVMHDFTYERGYVAMRMEAGGQVASMTLSMVQLGLADDAHGYVDSAWDQLERHLLHSPEAQRQERERQAREWRARWRVEQHIGYSMQVNPQVMDLWLNGA